MVFEYLVLFLLPVTNMTDGEPSYHITGFIECLFYQATMFGNAQKNILSYLHWVIMSLVEYCIFVNNVFPLKEYLLQILLQ